ncbi:hypothetical protein [Acinetobacter sp. Tr-809]
MDILKFLKSFNTIGSYLTIASLLLATVIVYFYYINPN